MKLHFVHFLSYIHFNSVDVHIKQCFKWWGQCMYSRSNPEGQASDCSKLSLKRPNLLFERSSQLEEAPWTGGGSTKAQYETNKDYIELSYKAAVAFRE